MSKLFLFLASAALVSGCYTNRQYFISYDEPVNKTAMVKGLYDPNLITDWPEYTFLGSFFMSFDKTFNSNSGRPAILSTKCIEKKTTPWYYYPLNLLSVCTLGIVPYSKIDDSEYSVKVAAKSEDGTLKQTAPRKIRVYEELHRSFIFPLAGCWGAVDMDESRVLRKDLEGTYLNSLQNPFYGKLEPFSVRDVFKYGLWQIENDVKLESDSKDK